MATASSKKLNNQPYRFDEDNATTTSHESQFLALAGLILPWLTLQELAAISTTCKHLNQISKSISLARSSDASHSLENIPIPFINTIDSRPYSYFMYAPSQLHIPRLTSSSGRQYWGGPRNPNESPHISQSLHDVWIGDPSSGGCDCGPHCADSDDEDVENGCCPCSALRSNEVVTECGPRCTCNSNCPNRSTQTGVRVKLKIIRDKNKGWGLFADQVIPSGEFICEYVGELLTTPEARIRQKKYDEQRFTSSSTDFSSALLVVREHLPSGKACFRINIDATRVGNVARFVNHCCDGGNLSSVLVRRSGSLVPRVCFFASRDVMKGEELSFSYGGIRLKSSDGLKCYCGSPSCYGVLPSEKT